MSDSVVHSVHRDHGRHAPLLKGVTPSALPQFRREKIGISYSGGGPLVVYELGVARALVKHGIVPDVVAGVSAGSLTVAAHALDVHGGRGIEMGALDVLAHVSTQIFGLTLRQIIGHLLSQRTRMPSLGNNAPLKELSLKVLR